jgi:hypothetical protein
MNYHIYVTLGGTLIKIIINTSVTVEMSHMKISLYKPPKKYTLYIRNVWMIVVDYKRTKFYES